MLCNRNCLNLIAIMQLCIYLHVFLSRKLARKGTDLDKKRKRHLVNEPIISCTSPKSSWDANADSMIKIPDAESAVLDETEGLCKETVTLIQPSLIENIESCSGTHALLSRLALLSSLRPSDFWQQPRLMRSAHSISGFPIHLSCTISN